MFLHAPPYVTSGSPFLFIRGDTTGLRSGPLFLSPISVEEPLLSASVIVSSSLLTEGNNVTITCGLMPSSQTIDIVHQLSGNRQ